MKRQTFSVIMMTMLLSASLMLAPERSFANSAEIGGGIMTPAFETRPDLGIRAGAFMIYPKITAGMVYNDNIYATKNNEESDWIATVAPRIMASSTWSCHSLKLDAGIRKGFYLEESSEDYLNAHVMAGGRLNILRTSYFELKTGYESYYEDRMSPDAIDAWKKPARYERLSADASLNHEMGRFIINTGGGAAGYLYKKVDLVDGGSENQSIRDYISYTARAQLGYDLHPDIKPFVKADYNWRRYDKYEEAQRDSDGYRVGAGTQIYMGGITSGDVWGGYMRQDYDFENRDDISSVWYGLGLTWDVTRLTSIRAGVERTIKETTQAGASGIVGTTASLTVRHALLRDISPSLSLSYTHDDYKGIDITSKYYKISPGITYAMNRNFSAALQYDYTRRDSSQDKLNREFDVNQITFSVTAAF
jgi:hypothetical protein